MSEWAARLFTLLSVSGCSLPSVRSRFQSPSKKRLRFGVVALVPEQEGQIVHTSQSAWGCSIHGMVRSVLPRNVCGSCAAREPSLAMPIKTTPPAL